MTIWTPQKDKPRVVLIHPHCFSQRDMQWYAPLADEFDLVAVTPRLRPDQRTYDGVPQCPLVSVDQVAGAIPVVQKALDKLARLRSENLYWYHGLAPLFDGAAIVECLETFHPYCWQASQNKARFGYKLVYSVHENIAFAHENLGIRRKIKSETFRCGDAFTPISEQGANSLILEGAPPEKIHVMGAATDTDLFTPGPPDADRLRALGVPAPSNSDKGGDNGAIVLLWAGRLVWEKGAQDAIEALGLLRRFDATRKYHLFLAGDGPDRTKLESIADRAGVRAETHFLGRVARPDMIALYRRADMCLVPSIPTPRWQEQFGCVLIEAQACGCPVVAAHSGAIAEVVGDAGVLVAPNQHTDLFRAIMSLAADRPRRADLARRGRLRVVARYDNRVMAENIARVYRGLLGKTKAGNASGGNARFDSGGVAAAQTARDASRAPLVGAGLP